MEEKIDQIITQLDKFNDWFDQIEQNLDNFKEKLDRAEKTFETKSNKINESTSDWQNQLFVLKSKSWKIGWKW